MNTKKITFPNARGEQLAARLELPDDEQPVAYAIFAHCFTCSKNIKAAVNILPEGEGTNAYPRPSPPPG